MKIVHAADTHVGWRQYGSLQREEDFLSSFREIIEKTLEIGPDVFVHAGDLFHLAKPANKDIFEVASGIKRLIDANIEVVVTPGNHDKRPSRYDIAPQSVLELQGVKVFRYSAKELRPFVIKGVEFWGMPYVAQRKLVSEFLRKVKDMAGKPAVLVLHQGLAPLYPEAEIYPEEIPSVFSYVALGHYHVPLLRDNYGYPGCPQISEMTEEEINNSQRFIYEVDIGEKTTIKRHLLKSTRPFFLVKADQQTLAQKLQDIKEEVLSCELKPVLLVKLEVEPGYHSRMLAELLDQLGMEEAFIKTSVQVKPKQNTLFRGRGQPKFESDILEQLLRDNPKALELARVMFKASSDAQLSLEDSSKSAQGEKQWLKEQVIAAAEQYLEEVLDEVDPAPSGELFEPPAH